MFSLDPRRKGKGSCANLMDDETAVEGLSGLTEVTQLFTLRTRTEAGSSAFAARLRLPLCPPSRKALSRSCWLRRDGNFVPMLQACNDKGTLKRREN